MIMMMKKAMKIWIRKAKGIYQYPRSNASIVKTSSSKSEYKNSSFHLNNDDRFATPSSRNDHTESISGIKIISSSKRANLNSKTNVSTTVQSNSPKKQIHIRHVNTSTKTEAVHNATTDSTPYFYSYFSNDEDGGDDSYSLAFRSNFDLNLNTYHKFKCLTKWYDLILTCKRLRRRDKGISNRIVNNNFYRYVAVIYYYFSQVLSLLYL